MFLHRIRSSIRVLRTTIETSRTKNLSVGLEAYVFEGTLNLPRAGARGFYWFVENGKSANKNKIAFRRKLQHEQNVEYIEVR